MSVKNIEVKARTPVVGITIVLMGAILTGCSEGPTDAELHKALQAEMDRTNQLAQTMLGMEAGAKAATMIHALDKLHCKLSEADGQQEYRCQVELDITYPPAKRQKRKASIRMVKEENGWTVIKGL